MLLKLLSCEKKKVFCLTNFDIKREFKLFYPEVVYQITILDAKCTIII